LETLQQTNPPQPRLLDTLRVVLYIIGTLLLFFFALELMIASFQHLGRDIVQTIIQATLNPFTGLFIGLLITAMIQSSSTTTALVVALVASGSLTLQSAVPIIMGANVGTTITSTIVSLGFISKKKEFRKAVAAGTYHCFFNLLTVIILFPLEYYYGFLSSVSEAIGNYFFTPSAPSPGDPLIFIPGFNPVIDLLLKFIPGGFVLIVLSFALLFGSILLFRKVISDLLKAKSPEAFSRFFFKNRIKSFAWGLLTTAAIRSSTITTSVVVPVVAKRIATLGQAAPFIMGANVGTTITAFIAVSLNANASAAISIAVAHFLFNLIGVLLFFPIPVLRKLPIKLANGLGKLTLRYPLACFVFILLTFFFIPFSLIYLNQDTQKVLHLTYERKRGTESDHYRVVSRINTRNGDGEWTKFNGLAPSPDEKPALIYPVYVKTNSLFVGRVMYLFNKPGFCWDGEDEQGKYQACVTDILQRLTVSGVSFDSVFVFTVKYINAEGGAPRQTIYLSGADKVMLKTEFVNAADSIVATETLIGIEKNK
jgi:sodium-dependent phosphate cotransporter